MIDRFQNVKEGGEGMHLNTGTLHINKWRNCQYRLFRIFMLFNKGLLMFSLLFLLGYYSVAANETSHIIRKIDKYNDLSQAWITTIAQDYIGFIWFGTHDGVYRFDGYELKGYMSIAGDYLTLPGNNVKEIFEDSQKNLWVITSRGLCRYDRNRDCFAYYPEWPDNNFSDIAEDEDGNVYFGAFTGFFQYIPDSAIFRKFIPYPDSSKINNGHQEVYVTKANRIILNGPYGLSEFNSKSKLFLEIFKEPLPYDGDAVTCLLQDYNNAFWFGTRDYGLVYYAHLESGSYQRIVINNKPFLNSGTVLSIMESSDSVLWIGTENNGLILFDLKEFYGGTPTYTQIRNTEEKFILSNNSIFSITEDNQKNIWIGTYNGLNLYSPYFTDFNHLEISFEKDIDISKNIVNLFLEDNEDIWIGTEDGIRIFNREDKSLTFFFEELLIRN